MGVGEDESIGGCYVSVTIIATGFEADQQDVQLSNTEAKKIIHALEERSKSYSGNCLTKNVISDIELPKQANRSSGQKKRSQ